MMSIAECGGTLKFVIILDASKIVKNQMLERVSLHSMNRALDVVIKRAIDDPFGTLTYNQR